MLKEHDIQRETGVCISTCQTFVLHDPDTCSDRRLHIRGRSLGSSGREATSHQSLGGHSSHLLDRALSSSLVP